MVPGLAELAYEKSLESLRLPSMQCRRKRGDMIEVYKFTHEMYDVSSPLIKEGDTRNRGHMYKLRKCRVNTGLRQHFFSNRVTDIWNGLPIHVVNAPSLNSFKNRLDYHWKEHMHHCI